MIPRRRLPLLKMIAVTRSPLASQGEYGSSSASMSRERMAASPSAREQPEKLLMVLRRVKNIPAIHASRDQMIKPASSSIRGFLAINTGQRSTIKQVFPTTQIVKKVGLTAIARSSFQLLILSCPLFDGLRFPLRPGVRSGWLGRACQGDLRNWQARALPNWRAECHRIRRSLV